MSNEEWERILRGQALAAELLTCSSAVPAGAVHQLRM